MIDIFTEHVVDLKDASKLIPGRPVSTATVFRWASKGVNGVKLETAQLGGRKVTSKEAIQRFVTALSQKTEAANQRPSTEKNSLRQKRIAKTQAKLDQILGKCE